MTKIILATASPYRQTAFKSLDIDFTAEASGINEAIDDRPTNPEMLVKMLAKMKAEHVAGKYSEGIVIGFDSVGFFNDNVLEKPFSKQDAFNRLKMLSGKRHEFYTGIHLIYLKTGQVLSKAVKTEIFMRRITDSEINRYLDKDSKFNTYSLGYDPLGHYSSSFIQKIEGSYNNLIYGLPLETVAEMLATIGFF